jgi:hypothetical protein
MERDESNLAGELRRVACSPTAAGLIGFFAAPFVRPQCGANMQELRLSVSSASARSMIRRRFRRTCIFYVRSKLPWVTLPEGVPGFEAYYDSQKLSA